MRTRLTLFSPWEDGTIGILDLLTLLANWGGMFVSVASETV